MRKLDVMDAEQVEKYERGLLAIKNAKHIDGSASQKLKAQCRIVKDFFAGLFGEGVLQEEEVLKGWNYRDHFMLLDGFIMQTNKDFEEENKKMNEIAAKYTANRAARRQ